MKGLGVTFFLAVVIALGTARDAPKRTSLPNLDYLKILNSPNFPFIQNQPKKFCKKGLYNGYMYKYGVQGKTHSYPGKRYNSCLGSAYYEPGFDFTTDEPTTTSRPVPTHKISVGGSVDAEDGTQFAPVNSLDTAGDN